MTCSTCTANMHGGCVELGSQMEFDAPLDPFGICDKFTPRTAAALEMQRPPTKRDDSDRAQLTDLLGSINRQHAPNVWDARMARSEGRR